ncbi:MAG: class I SAM-dependent methyltransferase [Arcanobacterium sp.]|nr:class I SAM-dependent methyltransferase [Arcanobacterium sp.]
MESFGRENLRPTDDVATTARSWWNENAAEYLSEHGEILGESDFIWGPEGLRESEIELLGTINELRGKKILEIGSGAAQCARYLAKQGILITASDISPKMLEKAKELNRVHAVDFPLIEADARKLPFEDESFDVVFTSFGVLPFIPDLSELNREIARVLRDKGLWVYSAMHPVRWMFPDDPSESGMTVTDSYFGSEPYLERDKSNILEYAEFPHQFSEHLNALTDTGFYIEECIEPRWPAGRDIIWGGWGPYRSRFIPGTLILKSRKIAK